MEMHIQLSNVPIPETISPLASDGAGAWTEFRGRVRGEENGAPIVALEYEAYSPMAEIEMGRLLEELSAKHPCLAAKVVHRLGIVPVGEVAIYVGIAARHRGAAFALLAEFMDHLKRDVPIWKRRAVSGVPIHIAADSNRALGASDVLTLLRKLCRPLPTERVCLGDAAGRVLREPVTAPENQPPFDRSAMDGYAVRLDDNSKQFRIVDEIRAGDWKPRQLQPGEAVRIATGGALPGDGLQVVIREDVQFEAGTLSVLRRDAERHIRFCGDDARAGQVLVEPETTLSPGALALLASVGAAKPLVTRLPRVLHVVTGNEIVPPEQASSPGQIRDSNSTLVRAFLKPWRIEPEHLRVPEDETVALSSLVPRPSSPDLLLISGGASVGEHDFTRRLLEDCGFTIHVSKTATRPGKPLIVAQRGGTLAFGLPGNPLAHFVCLNLYVRAALDGLAGRVADFAFQTGTLATDLVADGNARETFWPACWEWREGVAALTPLRWSSSGDLTALATANALMRVTAGARILRQGSRVEFVPTGIHP